MGAVMFTLDRPLLRGALQLVRRRGA
jgi:hypothetical protein